MTMHSEHLKTRLPERIALTGKSEGQIADDLGIGRRTFNNYCNGRVPRDPKVLDKIAVHLGTNRFYLVGDSEDSSPISTNLIHKPLTPPLNNGTRSKEGEMVEMDLYRSLVLIGNEMAALRQDLRLLTDRLAALETGGGNNRPTKGRKGTKS